MKNDGLENEPSRFSDPAAPSPEVVRKIIEVIKTVRYGSVEVIIQDARVVQIERKEKFRFDRSERS